MNYRPSFCIVKTVVNQLFPQVRIPSLSKTAQNQTHISRESTRSLVQVRREHALNGNTVLFQSTTNFFLRKTKKTCFGKLYGQTPQRWFFGFSLGKISFQWKNQLFPRKRMVLDQKTNFFLGKDGFGPKNQLFPRKTKKTKKKPSFGKLYGRTPKRWFFWFSLGKSWFFAPKPSFS